MPFYSAALCLRFYLTISLMAMAATQTNLKRMEEPEVRSAIMERKHPKRHSGW